MFDRIKECCILASPRQNSGHKINFYQGSKMIQVTAIYQGSEIGYGEGEALSYAIDDCAASIPAIFEDEIIEMSILDGAEINQIKGRLYLNIDGAISIA